jgi:1-acyl-sn-glycerol-3-phosphate acyltransferase
MIRTLRSAWIWLASAVLFLFWCLLLGAIRLFDRDPRRIRTARWFRRLGRALAKLQPWRVHITGLENIDPSQRYVVVSNHQSLADIPVVAHLRIDAKWLGKSEIFRLPVIGWMMHWAGDVPVERANKRKAATALLQCAKYLRQGLSIVFFPEGTRSPGGHVLPFNEGPFQLAVRERAPILPLVVEGTGAALPRDSWRFGSNLQIQVRVLKAVPVDTWSMEQVPLLRDAVRQLIVDELNRVRGL